MKKKEYRKRNLHGYVLTRASDKRDRSGNTLAEEEN